MPNFQILPATPDDVRGIINVLYKTWLDTYPNEELNITREAIEESYKEVLTEENIQKRIESAKNIPANQKRIIAKVDGQVVGCSIMVRNEDNTQLKTIYVLPEFQGQGIGKALWNEQIKFADPDKDIIVHLATYHQDAIEFYKKIGFEDTGKRFTDEDAIKRTKLVIPEMEMVIKKTNHHT